MCYHHEDDWRREGHNRRTPPRTTALNIAAAVRSAEIVDNLRRRLADTEARLARARAREAALSRQLNDMKRFVSVMEILEIYLKRRFSEQQNLLSRLLASVINDLNFRLKKQIIKDAKTGDHAAIAEVSP